MPNLNVSSAGSANAFTQLLAWLTGTGPNQMAWTLFDTISSTDVVLSTSGVPASNRPATLYVRMTQSWTDEAPGNAGTAWDNVTFRLYRTWNAGTHTGYGESGRLGPRLWLGQLSTSTETETTDYPAYWLPTNSTTVKASVNVAQNGLLDPNSIGITTTAFTINQFYCNPCWDGRRFWHMYNTHLYAYDALLDQDVVVGSLPSGFGTNQAMAYTVDPIAGRDFLWSLSYSTTSGQQWWKYDIAAATWISMADSPWLATSSNNQSQLCWDGGQLIYALQGLQGVGFASYNISTNSWTTLTGRPVDSNWSSGGNWCGIAKMLYVPATLSGLSHDRIFMVSATEGASTDTNWWYYDVTAATWTLAAAMPLAHEFPVATVLSPVLGAGGKIFYATYNGLGSGTNAYEYDIPTNAWSGALTFNFALTDWSASSPRWWHMFRDEVGKFVLPTSSSNMQLQAQGNKDYFSIIATWVLPFSSIKVQRYVYVGFYNTYGNVNSLIANGGISPGTNVVVTTTTDPTGKYSPGDPILIYDQNADVLPQYQTQSLVSGGGEVCTITGVGTNTLTLAHVIGTYSSGVILGGDPMPAIVTNDTGFVTSLTSGDGYWGDGEADFYRQRVLEPDAFSNLVGPRGTTIGFPVVLYNLQAGSVMNEIIGELYQTTVGPDSANATQIAIDETSQYAILIRYPTPYSGDPRPLQLGIINA